MDIVQAQTTDHLQTVRALFREYETFLDVDLCFQDFEQELAGLPGDYAPPDGLLLLAVEANQAAACGALRRLDADVCEMKRLFVRPEFRGVGLGRTLAKRLIDSAARMGYHRMVLDTLKELNAAMALYESLGFMRIAPYYHNPLPRVVYWELDLRMGPGRKPS